MSVISVVGARPNFMKIAPVISALSELNIPSKLVHTGQHYDWNMSESFFDDLSLPIPNIFLGVGSGTHAKQTAKVMLGFEKVCTESDPNLVIVAGDVNSTLACALVAAKLNIPTAHVESGLSSFDNSMPEDINRILTDRISDLLFVTEESALKHLINDGVSSDRIHFVGNCMIDSVSKYIQPALYKCPWKSFGLNGNDYCLVTMHRPSNVDSIGALNRMVQILNKMAERIPIIFPIHPRTRSRINQNEIKIKGNIRLSDPLPYLEFLGLLAKAQLVVTDSGGIQEETTYLGIQCITYRENTERPITIEIGTNHLTGTNPEKMLKKFDEILDGNVKNGQIPPKWDGKAGKRIAKIIGRFLS
ncbi:MAG: UDP-N-acetylglucosamine 2-epimerase (non-hydrolyzing) [Candidatus Neomarinimicrobiota bacterium]|nr:UDP-N-acetylglucosamine 2-epimerase (non-hydrolyzing) [Candidatus Neomarinimicrobiota bacterium]